MIITTMQILSLCLIPRFHTDSPASGNLYPYEAWALDFWLSPFFIVPYVPEAPSSPRCCLLVSCTLSPSSKKQQAHFCSFETELILRTASGFLALCLLIKAECKQRKWKLQGLHWQLLSGEAFLPIRKRLLWQRDFSLLTYSNPSLINFVLQLNEFLF